MRGFWEYLWHHKTPDWVAAVAIITLVLGSMIALSVWLAAVLSTGSLFVLLAPFAAATWLLWNEYKHSKGDHK